MRRRENSFSGVFKSESGFDISGRREYSLENEFSIGQMFGIIK